MTAVVVVVAPVVAVDALVPAVGVAVVPVVAVVAAATSGPGVREGESAGDESSIPDTLAAPTAQRARRAGWRLAAGVLCGG